VRIVVFGDERRVGALLGDVVVDLERASREATLSSLPALPPDLGALIERGPAAIDHAERLLRAFSASADLRIPRDGMVYRVDSVHLHAPAVRGAMVACAGGNFADQAAAVAARRSGTTPRDTGSVTDELRARGLWGFWKATREIAGPGDDVPYPARTRLLDYEGEVAIVIGNPAKNARAEDLRQHVWGVTLFADWSIRDSGESWPQQFAMSKNFDRSFSVGPCIVVGEDLDPDRVHVETRVNGDLRQCFETSAMVHSFGECLAFLTRDLTFHPGDMISSGTGAGTAADSSSITDGKYATERFLAAGDIVEIRSPSVGILTNTIVPQR
jgi:2-keto-4-pentenoate hydratase/2-oxohepta-3-ene-1,7-dioic acid hydratase in catechol pathway